MFFRQRSLVIWCFAAVALGGATAVAEESAAPVKAWAPREFPLVAWGGPAGSFNTPAHWKTVKDANFTLALAGGQTVAENRKALEICKGLNLPLLLPDARINPEMTAKPGWRKTVAAILSENGPHPALEGFYGWDEPASDLFAPLGALNQEFTKQAPNLLFHINLFPTYATPQQLGTPNYRDHLKRYLAAVKPQVLCFDHYALMADGAIRPDYFENLALIREEALKNRLPPWIFILSSRHFNYADPNEGQMRWQAYTALAYGMKGILYFLYWPYKPLSDTAIVDLEGKPTRLYPIVKKINGEIRTLGKTLLSLTSTGAYHTGRIPAGAARLPLDAPLQLPADKSLVVGLFEDPGKIQYVLIANADPQQPVDFTVTLHPEVKRLWAISPADGEASPVALSGNQAAYRLEAGDGRLFRLDTEFKYPAPKKVEP
jgi:hypothetical protein